MRKGRRNTNTYVHLTEMVRKSNDVDHIKALLKSQNVVKMLVFILSLL